MNKFVLFWVMFLVLSMGVFAVLDDAVLYYSLDNDDLSGSDPLDSSGNANTGTNNGATTGATGLLNQAFDFERTESDYIAVGTDASISITGPWSISAWVKIESSWSYNVIALKGATGSTYPAYGFLVSGLKPTIWSNGASGSPTGGSLQSTTNLANNTWYHLVAVHAGNGAGQTTIYINNVLDTTGTTETPYSSANPLEVGRWNGGGTMDGLLDEVAIYDRALTTDEIEELYNAGSGYNPYSAPVPTPFFDVSATDASTSATLYNITVTLQNGTQYTNVSNAIVTTPFNDSSLRNFTVSVANYFSQTFTNYNTSVDLQANMTQYPYVAAYDPYDNASIQTFNVSYTYGGASYCYQETANVSTACGGLATGTYATNGTWVSSTYNTYDGDWTTYSNGLYPQNNVNLFINYSKPSAWIGAPYWQVKTEDGTPTKTTQNITLTAACYTDSIIQLRIQKIAGQTIKFLCYNGSTWYQLDQSANSADSYVYEEAMIWRLPTTQVTNYKEYVALNDTYTVTMSKSGYFSKTLTHDFTNSTDINATLVQAQVRFNASQIITGTYLSAANFTINGVTKGSGEAFYLDADTYNVQFSASGYYAKNASVVVSALQNNTVTVSGVSSSAIHINATNILNTTPILNFDIVITNDYYGYVDNYSTVSGGVDVSILANTPFNITINATGYALANTTIITNYTLYNYTFNLYTAESILFTIYDEISQEQINGTNFTIAIIGTYQALNRTTSNGTLYVDLLTPDDYEIRYYSTNSNDYALRTLFVTVSKQSFQAIDLYTLNGSTTSATIADVKFIVYDQNLQPLENALVTVKRYYINQNGYLSVYSRYTNTAGEVLGQFEATDAFYQYTVTYNNVVIYSSSAVGTQFYDGQIIPIYVDTTGAFSTELSEILAVTSSLVFTSTSNTTGYFTYTYSSASVVQACLRLNTFSSGGSVNNESCQSPTTSGTIVVAVDSNNAVKTYTALAYIRTSSSSDYWLDKQLTVSLNYGSPLVSSEAWRDNILFGAILILLMSGLLYIRFPAVAILVQTIIMVMLAAPPLYLLPILPVTLGWIIALALFLLISTRRRGVQ